MELLFGKMLIIVKEAEKNSCWLYLKRKEILDEMKKKVKEKEDVKSNEKRKKKK
jgi:hypothetical protein